MDTIKAAIFDLDGTLVDSMWVWERIDMEFLKKRGYTVPENLKDNITHLSFKQVAQYFKTTFSIDDSVEAIMDEWHEMAYNEYSNNVFLKEGRAAGRRGHPCPRHQHPHHQAAGRGDRPEGGQRVRQGDHRRGAQRHRRSGRSRVRRPVREAAHPRAPRGRAGCVRLLRPRLGPAGKVRPGCCHHLQDRT